MKLLQSTLLAFLLLLCISCEDEMPIVDPPVDPTPMDAYESGVFIINEGPFGSGTGTVDFIDDEGVLTSDIYGVVNDGSAIGNILQSMTIVGDRAFLAANNAAKVEVVNASTFEYIGTIPNISQPRYITDAGNDQVYISAWGSDGVSGEIIIADAISLDIIDRIAVGGGPEEMMLVGEYMYVVNSGGFGNSNEVYKINTTSQSIERTFEFADKPNSLVSYDDGDIWILCGGFNNFNPDDPMITPGELVQIGVESDLIEYRLDLPYGAKKLVTDGTTAYYSTFDGVFSFFNRETAQQKNLLIPNINPYGMDANPKNGDLYVLDAKDFASAGELTIYDSAGVIKNTYTTGIVPNGAVFTP